MLNPVVIDIRKVNGTWRVIPGSQGPVQPGTEVEWRLYPDGEAVSAHLQFTHRDLVESGSSALSPDWTASVSTEPGQNEPGTIRLRVKSGVCRRSNDLNVSGSSQRCPRHYAVWIMDKALPDGGMYAVGDNPPPEIDVGG